MNPINAGRNANRILAGLAIAAGLSLAACGREPAPTTSAAAAAPAGTAVAVLDTTIVAAYEAAGTAQPYRQATMSTKLMGQVLEVPVQAGDVVREGQVLVRLDTRDLAAREQQVTAAIAGAEAMYREAQQQATRMRNLHADSAAPTAMLDQAEAGLARAEAGLAQARGQQAELVAVTEYGTVRAPFAGTVTQRFVDPGALAAPGAPLVAVEDASRLRIVVTAAPDIARGINAGQHVAATIEGAPVDAVVEAVVRSSAGNLSTIQALVPNAGHALLSGSAATIALPQGTRPALLVPGAAIVRQGDLTGIRVLTPAGADLRWVRLGMAVGTQVEVLSGVSAGDRVLVPQEVGPASPKDS